ncbi:hypothetical protein [Flavobacterium subsaxonicum]|uniref:Uncharacterized protein n=1 Tax=Flavobacterium subsaxonicum WB 4.1-42 = DSM 21790 TaxID=1121898 RepID=A0A0A2MM29_9FLAO|nr:hypothetical protein [Flavobacterium subsaxonicum]KGO93667.1 hypothetical protein Q766_06820 [Flavobacterium subsaxonicum WB 4.1-42 = DSM 21790]
MESLLKEKLWAHIAHHNPDLMLNLQADHSVTKYLDEKMKGIMPMIAQLVAEAKPQYIIQELCLKALTSDLIPSKFHYIRSIIEEDFSDDFERLKKTGILTFEVANLITICNATVFKSLGFTTDNLEDRHLRYAVIAEIYYYLLG